MHDLDSHFLTPHHREAEILRHRRAGDLSLYDMRYDPARRSDWHAHQSIVLELPLSGGYHEDYMHTHRYCVPGRLQVYAPDARHVSVGGPDATRIFHVILPGADMPRALNEEALLTVVPSIAGIYASLLDPTIQANVVASLRAAIARAASDHASPGWLDEARRIVHDRFADSIGLRDVALDIGVNASHLGRTVRARWGCSLGEYLRRVRVARATEKLIQNGDPLLTIAHSCGYADQSHFCREFGRLVGVSPGRFRRLLTT